MPRPPVRCCRRVARREMPHTACHRALCQERYKELREPRQRAERRTRLLAERPKLELRCAGHFLDLDGNRLPRGDDDRVQTRRLVRALRGAGLVGLRIHEGLAVAGGSFVRSGDQGLVDALEKFNQTQDYRILRSLVD